MKKTFFMLIMSLFIVACGGDDKCDPACADWQTCNVDKCETAAGKCATKADCKTNEICNEQHTCVADSQPECTTDADCKDSAKPTCDAGVCVAEITCNDGDKRCNSDKLETCSSNSWNMTEDCAASGKTCNTSTLACEENTQSCNAGDRRCDSEKVQVCGTHNDWTTIQDCGAIGKTCNATTFECEGGTSNPAPFHILAETVEFNDNDTMTIPTNVHGSIALFSKYPISVGILNDEATDLTINSIVLTYGDRVMEEEFTLLEGSIGDNKLEVNDEVIAANGRFDFRIKFYPVASHLRTATLTITYNTDKTFVLHLTGEGGSDANFSTPTRTVMNKVLGGADLDEMISGSVTDAQGNTYFSGNDTMIAGADGFNKDIIIGQIKADGSLGWLKVWYGPKHDLSIDPGQNGESGGSSNSITMDDEGNIYVVGVTSKTSGSNYAALIIKLNPADGSIIWEKVWRPEFRSSQIGWQEADAYAVDVKGDYVYVAGSTLGNAAVMFLALNKSDGSVYFNKAFDLTHMENDRAFCLKVDNNGNAYMGGSLGGSAMLMKVNSVNTQDPQLEWVKSVDGGTGTNINSMDIDEEGKIYAALDVRGAATSFTFLKFDTDGSILWGNQNASSGQKNNVYLVRYLNGSVYAGGRVGIGEIDGVVGYDTQFGDGYLIKANKDTGDMDWSLFYYSGKGPDEIAGFFVKGLGFVNNKLYVIGHMWAKSGNRYNGYWYDGVQALTSYAPSVTDVPLLTGADLVDHIDLPDAEVQDASGLRQYIDAPMGTVDNDGDKRKFTYSDASEKHHGYGPDNDLSYTVLEVQ